MITADQKLEKQLQQIDITKPAPEEEPQRQYYFIKKLSKWVKKREEELGRPLYLCTKTFGCQMNAKDSEKLEGIMEKAGLVKCEDETTADFIFYNTCTVRENANLKVYGRLGHLKKMKQKNPNLMIALCGCMMQESTVVDKIVKSYSFVDIIFGTHNIFKLAELVCNRIDAGSMIVDIWKDTDKIVEELPSERKYGFKCGVNIMYGCNNFCSYCIVPYVRGRERSRKPEDIINEIKQAVSEGVVEIMLLGQNVNSYGKNLEHPMTFAALLREVEKIDGLERIRFMTPHPKDLSDELIETMANSKKICKHLHLPVQSGSTKVLKAMNRHYTKEQYLSLVKKIQERMPDVALTTDIIVGFPGETREDFLETLDVVKKVRYDSAFTFQYSKRTGTRAALMEDQISKEEVQKNFDELLKTVSEISKEKIKRLEGTVQEVLVEGENDHDDTLVTGRLSNNTLVHFKGDQSDIGKIMPVFLKEAKGFYYMGERVQCDLQSFANDGE